MIKLVIALLIVAGFASALDDHELRAQFANLDNLKVEGLDKLNELKMNQIYETTNWDFLEDMFLYHNAIRYFHDVDELRFNRTVSLFSLIHDSNQIMLLIVAYRLCSS